ncbi:MAG: FliM/FliN family flagellar motor switch protein [Candidatus Gastranaerophilales bacterium]|nr:FliM/FliN family flagellar motor switch protein [Candidatus Gastranaerophilales bacterium]
MSENFISKDSIFDIKNLEKIKNVKVRLYAELGKTNISLKDAIEYDSGSIIDLNKMEDETVDVYVDDILIAKAKIVAIEDSYGIKIVEIMDYKKEQQEDQDK